MPRRVSVQTLVGRLAELAVLDHALAEVAEGHGRMVLIEGDAGVGKTRLVRTFTERATDAGSAVPSGGCPRLEADIPFAPFATALRGIPDAERLLLAGDDPSGDGGRAREFRRVADAVVATAADRPVVLSIEDVHWSDASTRDLLGLPARGDRRGACPAARHPPHRRTGRR